MPRERVVSAHMAIEDARIDKQAVDEYPSAGSHIGKCEAVVYSLKGDEGDIKAWAVPSVEKCTECIVSEFCDKTKKP